MSETPEPAAEPKRRWYQFHLWHLFVLIAVAAIACGWVWCKMLEAKRQREAGEVAETIKQLEGRGWVFTFRDGNLVSIGQRDRMYTDESGRTLLWPEPFITGEFVSLLEKTPKLESLDLSDYRPLDQFAWLKELRELRRLGLSSTAANDASLVDLKDMSSLEWLDLGFTAVTDGGLVHLRGFSELKVLRLDGTPVTNEGIKELQQALPNCEIIHDHLQHGVWE